MSAQRGLTLVLLLVAALSCRPDDQRTDTMDVQEAIQREREQLPVEVVAHLDSGSAAFRRDDYQGALDHYTEAAEIDANVAAAWFGIYMAQQALGNAEAAEEALRRAQSVEPGATLIHPTSADTIP